MDIDRLDELASKSTGWQKANRLRVAALARAAAGNLEAAETQARAAVDGIASTDLVLFHADAQLTPGDVLRSAGRPAEEGEAFREALDP